MTDKIFYPLLLYFKNIYGKLNSNLRVTDYIIIEKMLGMSILYDINYYSK